jgi:hypothetical protein
LSVLLNKKQDSHADGRIQLRILDNRVLRRMFGPWFQQELVELSNEGD